MPSVTSARRRGAISARGSYDRKLQTKAGPVTLKVPKLRRQTFETAIIERYRRREFGGEGPDRDVPGRPDGAAGGGHHRGAVALMLKAIHAQQDLPAAQSKAADVI